MLDKADGRSLRTGFLRQVSDRPNAPALVAGGVTRSYAELDHTARIWASAVHGVATRKPERVGIFGHRSEVSYTGALAALLSGATFVPLNPTFPAEKIAQMIEQADLQAIIVDKAGAALLGEIAGHVPVLPPLVMPEFEKSRFENAGAQVAGRGEIAVLKPLENLPPLTSEDIAYLLFTSGSTGKPKGVPVSHGNAVYFMDVMTERYQIGPGDRLSQTFDQTFDLSVFDLFMAWSNGACVYSMASIELLAPTKFINKHQLTVWFSVPSLPAHMIRRNTLTPGSLPSLRLSLFCGEPLPVRTAELWQAAAPNSAVENLYGPTELTIACFLHRWDAAASPGVSYNDVVPIGKPYPGLSALVVDENLSPVNPGEFGELLVSGPQTTPGYWRDPEKTAERYVMLPITDTCTRRFYRTGDRVARTSTGDYIFSGRVDFQIKVLGHRVELGEIEAAIRRNPAVEHVVACGWPITGGAADGIVCFATGNSLDENSLIQEVKGVLPPYAVPARIFLLSQMPMNGNGKLDRPELQKRIPLLMTSPAASRQKPASVHADAV